MLLVEDDGEILNALVTLLEGPERSLVACRDIESARLMLERLPVTHLVSDIGLASFSYAGLDLIQHALRHAPGAKIILMSGMSTPGLREEAQRRGATAFLRKPFPVEELEAHLAVTASAPDPRQPPAELMVVPLLDEIMADPGLTSVFQPICRLDEPNAPPMGFEGLTRLATNTPFRDPELLFRYAFEKERAADFELHSLERHWTAGAALPASPLLFTNIHPSVLDAGSRLTEAVLRAPIPPERLVLELTEQGPIPRTQSARDTVETLRGHGVRFAFDDLGMAYSHLQFLEHIRPAFLKISQHFGMSMATNAMSATVVRSLLHLAENVSAMLILEGIEDARTLEQARELGVPLGQGYFYARPASSDTFSQRSAVPRQPT